MPRARRTLVSLDSTPYYHCISRCVRQAYLCGNDQHTGRDYEHRRQWIVDWLHELSDVFAIDICAFAIMHTHFHVVLHVNIDEQRSWSDREVALRWCQLFSGGMLIHRYLTNQVLNKTESDKACEIIGEWRSRLVNISWFMKILNENIARAANHEDQCTGHFWEGRFKSQALLDDIALLACMAYVDLNPIRAAIADTPEDSDFTSIQQRIRDYAQQLPDSVADSKDESQKKTLMHFRDNESLINDTGIPFTLVDYIELVEWTGRVARDDKRGHIAEHLPPLLQRLKLTRKQWLSEFEQCQFQTNPSQQANHFLHGKFKHLSRHVVQVIRQRQLEPPSAAPPFPA